MYIYIYKDISHQYPVVIILKSHENLIEMENIHEIIPSNPDLHG